MNEQKWTLNAVFEWAQRVANGLPSVGLGTDIFEGIEATLKQRHDRIVELEAENASQRNHINMLEQQAATYGRWLRELKDENAALVSQSASGAGVQMEYQKIEYNKGQDFNDHIPNEWTLFAFYPSDENHFDIAVWQRPARSED
jgi:hypothetical protein